MGVNCSTDRDVSENDEEKGIGNPRHCSPPLARKRRRKSRAQTVMTDHSNSEAANTHLVDSLDRHLDAKGATVKADLDRPLQDVGDFQEQKRRLLEREKALAFDHEATRSSGDVEKKAAARVRQAMEKDLEDVYGTAAAQMGYAGQEHPRLFGDHFLTNKPLIEESRLYRIARKMPKGAHLHIHFNANLEPGFLIDVAKTMENMYISSDIPLVQASSSNDYTNFDRCRIQFNLRKLETQGENRGNLFDRDYEARQFMPFSAFREEFERRYPTYLKAFEGRFPSYKEGSLADKWLCSKLVFDEEEAHNRLQTSEGAWEKFNARTQMMKGLFNYEAAYRQYTKACLMDFVEDNIQYAEIRPNLMQTNQIFTDDGSVQLTNQRTVEIIIEVYRQFEKELKRKDAYFGGLKIIYCTPRSFDKEAVRSALHECLRFKEIWPEWIAGFDLVGEESKGHPLAYFAEELIEFKNRKKKYDIPFLFHCGETLEIGTDTDGNLADALLLGAKRIGHGFALARHPYIMEQMKKRNVCLEVCPISNEILGLTPRISGHSMYSLLANNVHCTVSTDNGTLFGSRLSHDFYQVFAGSRDMTLHGWRQLIEWSIEHSCMDEDEKRMVHGEWLARWMQFCDDIIREDPDFLFSS